MQGWVDLCYVKVDRLGIEPATCQLPVQRPNPAPPRNSFSAISLQSPVCRSPSLSTGHVTCCPLVSHDEYSDGTDRHTPDCIWNIVDKPPMWGITSMNGDGGLMQATLEAVDGSRLGRFFVNVVPLRICSEVRRISVCSCWCQGTFELVLVVTASA